MTIRHLQLNTSLLQSPEEIAKFVEKKNIDIACFQEINYPWGGKESTSS